MTSSNGVDFQSTVNSDGSPRPVSLGAPWRPNTLTLFGTGLRRASDLRVRIGSQEVDADVRRPAGGAPGVDQIVAPLPMTLSRGMTTVSLVVNSQSSATVGTSQASSATQSSATPQSSNPVQLLMQLPARPEPNTLSAADVQLIIAQAVAKAQQIGLAATIAVVDKEANVLGIFKMNGARTDVLLGSTDLPTGQPTKQLPNKCRIRTDWSRFACRSSPAWAFLSDGAALAAISKAGTRGVLQHSGQLDLDAHRELHHPGELSADRQQPTRRAALRRSVFVSSLLGHRNAGPANLPLGLSGDPGGVGIYKNGVAVGGVGVEVDGFYSVDVNCHGLRTIAGRAYRHRGDQGVPAIAGDPELTLFD